MRPDHEQMPVGSQECCRKQSSLNHQPVLLLVSSSCDTTGCMQPRQYIVTLQKMVAAMQPATKHSTILNTAANVGGAAADSMCSTVKPASLQNCSTAPCEDRDVLAVPKGNSDLSTAGELVCLWDMCRPQQSQC